MSAGIRPSSDEKAVKHSVSNLWYVRDLQRTAEIIGKMHGDKRLGSKDIERMLSACHSIIRDLEKMKSWKDEAHVQHENLANATASLGDHSQHSAS